jgi:hypothetical protein
MSSTLRSGRVARIAVAVAITAGASIGWSEETPTPVPTATPGPATTPTARPAGGQSLNQIAKDTKLKAPEHGEPIVISNENLESMAAEGSVTAISGQSESGRRPVRQAPGSESVVVRPDEALDTAERRNYWRNRYEEQINLIESLQQQIQRLDKEIPGLWTDFYSRDDPAYRDGVIKPKLDEYMARRQSLEEQLAAARPRLGEIKSEARRDGAEPGWFRGIPTPQPMPTSSGPAAD